jgi:uncharacterized membrane protein
MIQLEKRTKNLVSAALMSALVFVLTFAVRVPLPFLSGGYINIGDAMIYVCAYLFGGPLAAAAAAVGSGFADLAAGSAAYIIPTLIIKGIMGFAAGKIASGRGFKAYVAACLVGGAIMTTGYALFEFGFFSAAYSLTALPFNVVQWVAGVIVAVVVYPATKQLKERLKVNYKPGEGK